MYLLAQPPPSRYDLNFTVADIPIRVHPLFWLMTLLLGGVSGDIVQLVAWVAAVFLSILIHELGHALTMRLFGQPSRIVLHLMGGLTVPEASQWGARYATVALSPRQEILISLAGPGAGFLLATLVIAVVSLAGGFVGTAPLLGILPLPTAFLPLGGRFLNLFVGALLWVNVFWGLVNLLPVYPLDGGNVARRLIIISDPWAGVRKSLWVSVIAGGIAAVVGLLLLKSIYVTFLFGILAIQSYQSLQGHVGGSY